MAKRRRSRRVKATEQPTDTPEAYVYTGPKSQTNNMHPNDKVICIAHRVPATTDVLSTQPNSRHVVGDKVAPAMHAQTGMGHMDPYGQGMGTQGMPGNIMPGMTMP